MIRTGFAILVFSASVLSCGKSAEEEGREAVTRSQTAPEPATIPKPVKMGSAEPVPEKPPAPPPPEPTTPAEIDQARKAAMIDGRDQDVIKYCEMAKVEPGTSDPQVLLGCALAACRLNDPARAKPWASILPKPLKDQAIKVCLANQVAL